MLSRTAALGLALTAGLLLPASALAAPSANPPAKVRVHVDTDVFGFSHYNPQDNDADDSNTNVVGFGIGRPTFIDTGNFVIFDRPVLAFGVGGVILDGRAVIGARAAFTVDGVLRGNDNDTYVAGRLVPYFNWMFNPRGRIRGFLGGRFGFGGAAVTFEEFDDPDFVVRRQFNSIYPIVGVQGGMHIFIVERVSLDPGLSFDYIAPHSRSHRVEPDPEPVGDFDKDGDAVNFAVTFGLSAWF
ncbi:MAG: hypothetical protein AAGF11_12030 [Myxococcota bacterium]